MKPISDAAKQAREAYRQANGEFGVQLRGEATLIDLSEDQLTYAARMEGDLARHEALVNLGYAPPTALVALTPASSRDRIEEDWAQRFIVAGHGGDTQVPKARVDSSPGQLPGRSVTGLRRTYRKSYEVDGWTFRLGGSKTSILRDMAEMNTRTLDMTVNATDDQGRPVEMEMRITKGVNGLWAVTPLGVGGEKAAMAAAGVQAMLEARRPTMVPSYTGGLAARARDNMAAEGVEMSPNLRSQWMAGVNYSDVEGMMTMKTLTGRVYGYSVPKSVFEQIATSTSPGRVYNELVKTQKGHPTKAPQVDVTECGSCHRVYPSARPHRCPTGHAAPSQEIRSSNRVHDEAARSLADRILRRRRGR